MEPVSEMSFNAFDWARTNTCSMAPHTMGDAWNSHIDVHCLGELENMDIDASLAPRDASLAPRNASSAPRDSSPAPGDASPAQLQGMLAQFQMLA